MADTRWSKFCPTGAWRRCARSRVHFSIRLIFRRTRHININSMYEICQNEFRLGVTGDRHFSSGDEYHLDVKYRCIIASPASSSRVFHSCGKWTLFTDLFNDNYFYSLLFFSLLDIRPFAGSIHGFESFPSFRKKPIVSILNSFLYDSKAING